MTVCGQYDAKWCPVCADGNEIILKMIHPSEIGWPGFEPGFMEIGDQPDLYHRLQRNYELELESDDPPTSLSYISFRQNRNSG